MQRRMPNPNPCCDTARMRRTVWRSLAQFWIVAAIAVFCLPSLASAQQRGILGQPAPAWEVDSWVQLPNALTLDGKKSVDVSDYRGKVIYLYGFQSWCPGCHSSGFPTLKELVTRFGDESDAVFVAIQTTFEGFQTNTAEKALETAKRYKLTIPCAHSGSDGQRSKVMSAYRTGGTPWTIIIDRQGVVRFNDFHIKPDAGETLIRQLLAEPATPAIETLPVARGGQDRVGRPFSKVAFDRILKAEPATAPDRTPDTQPEEANPAKPKATLYRWWTDQCPHCEKSLPAIELLRKRYGEQGLNVVAVYHPKPARPIGDAFVRAAAQARGFHGDIAIDERWATLRDVYLKWERRAATSICLLIDADGVIRFVHPGPVIRPSKDPAHRRENADFEALERAIKILLDVSVS